MTILVDQIKRFALSVDYVTENHFESIKNLFRTYFQIIETWFYEVQVEKNHTIRRNQNVEPSLTTVFTVPGGNEPITSIKNEDGTYTGQTTYAYDRKIPMWIVREDKTSLKAEVGIDKGNYIDLWSGSRTEDIPAYWKYYQPETNNVKTSIIIPLESSDERTFGFLNLEFSEYLEPYPEITNELEEIVKSFSILWTLKETTALSNENTVRALDLVINCPRPLNNPMRPPQPPRLFLAYPLNACNNVMTEIRNALDESSNLQVEDWNEINQSGNISVQLLETISSCKYGICYFFESQPNQLQDQPRQYEISLNVIFEAGMLQSLTNSPTSEFVGWIPIWESNLTRPFDFAQERAIIVPRMTDGTLNRDEFNRMLRQRISALLRV